LKSAFPGDPEFSLENYSSLPWAYVVSAVREAADTRYKHLHEIERPTAMLSSIYANSQRDPKKSKGFTYLDFSFYKPLNDGDTPQSHYGAAYLELLRVKKLPSWALFCYKAFSASAATDYTPSEPGFIAEDAILLHPERVGKEYKGLLIALESASDQRRVFIDKDGNEIRLTVPFIGTKVVAEENVILSP